MTRCDSSPVTEIRTTTCWRAEKAAREAIRICMDRGVLREYLKEREKEVINIMITLFDQDKVTEAYGKRREREGRILDRIEVYREENKSEEEILNRIMDIFNLSKTSAESYMAEPTVKYDAAGE